MSFLSHSFDAEGHATGEFGALNARCETLCVVVPCYNEAKRLEPGAFLSVLSENPDLRFLMVNDGSRDQTMAVLTDLARRGGGRIEVLDLPRNGGKAEAVRRGLLAAVAAGHQVVGYWDADLATPLDAIEDLARVLRRLPDVEVVFGSRRRLLGHRIDRTLRRRIISRICASLARLAVRQPVGDTQCGAKLLRVTDSLRASIARPFTAGWLFDVELFTRISAQTAQRDRAFYEYPLSVWTEIPGSKVTGAAVVKSGLRMLRLIGAVRFGGLVAPIQPGRPANTDAAPRPLRGA